MAGVKGKSGGVRPNAGRKPAPKTQSISVAAKSQDDPLAFLLAVMNDSALDDKLRIEAAKAAVPYVHLKKGEGGKKDEKLDAAKQAGRGKFAAAATPLRMVK